MGKLAVLVLVCILPAAAQSPAGFEEKVRSAMEQSIEKQRASIQKQAVSAMPVANLPPSGFFTAPWPAPASFTPQIQAACDPMPKDKLDQLVNGAAKSEGVDPQLVQAVIDRDYSIVEFNNLLVRTLTPADGEWSFAGTHVEPVVEATRNEWINLVADSFEAPAEILSNVPVYGDTLLARLGGVAAAAAGMATEDGVALLFGDATLQGSRGLGLQSGLIRERVARAARAGCDLAMACVLPGSGSHRNYERAGFQLFYMRVNVKRSIP